MADVVRGAEESQFLAAERGEDDAPAGRSGADHRLGEPDERGRAGGVVVGPGMDRVPALRRERERAAAPEVIVVGADHDGLGAKARIACRARCRRRSPWCRARGRAPSGSAPGRRARRASAGAPVRSMRAERAARSRPPGPRSASATSRRAETATIPQDGVAPRSGVSRSPRAGPLDDDHRRRAVLARVEDLVAELGVVEVLGRAKRPLGIRLARLAGHHQHDLAPDVEAGVVVVAERRRGDPVAGEDDLGEDVAVLGERERQEGLLAGEDARGSARHRDLEQGARGEAHARQHLEALEEAARVAGGTKAEALELPRHVRGRPVRPRRPGRAAVHGGLAQVPDPAEEPRRLGHPLRRAGARDDAEADQREQEDPGQDAAPARHGGATAAARCSGTPRRRCSHVASRGRPPARGPAPRLPRSPAAGSRGSAGPRASGPWSP